MTEVNKPDPKDVELVASRLRTIEQQRDNLDAWNSWSKPPAYALKTIRGGRLKGMSDIDPVWRYGVLTRRYGPCGVGWYYRISKMWTDRDTPTKEVMVFAEVELFVRVGDSPMGEPLWSMPIVGIGGNKLIAEEGAGLHVSDEGYKMAVTDALSVACKMLGIAADVYMGRSDDSKYSARAEAPPKGSPKGTATESKLCPECNGPMWDNRKDKPYPNSPDWKCKSRTCGFKVWERGEPAQSDQQPAPPPAPDVSGA